MDELDMIKWIFRWCAFTGLVAYCLALWIILPGTSLDVSLELILKILICALSVPFLFTFYLLWFKMD
jgi:hypothetical protein